jgi:hypothetical protein
MRDGWNVFGSGVPFSDVRTDSEQGKVIPLALPPSTKGIEGDFAVSGSFPPLPEGVVPRT